MRDGEEVTQRQGRGQGPSRERRYRLLTLNDEQTPMEFVVAVTEQFFERDHEAALRLMLHTHSHGIGECGVYDYEEARSKMVDVADFAPRHQHPLRCVMEKV
jgi:ATP-dependent Clp protease adaptor protein ClpS